MINYAIGGISGWHIDLARYGNQSDMWVDYVRSLSGATGTLHATVRRPSRNSATTIATAAPTSPVPGGANLEKPADLEHAGQSTDLPG